MQSRVCTELDRRQAAAWMSRRIGMEFPDSWFIRNTGIAVFDADRLYAVIILYIDRAGNIGQIGWTMTHPENSPRESYRALSIGIPETVKLARNCGVRYLMSYIAVPGVNRLLKKSGFADGDAGGVQKCKILY